MKRRHVSILAQLAMSTSSMLAFSAVQAATFSINPTRVELDARHRAEIVTLYNSGDAPLRMQARAMHWQMQTDGQWKLDPSDDLIVTPELAEIAPGKSVELRVGSLVDAGQAEGSYRLLLNELPGLVDEKKAGQIRVLTEISLPVFVEPAQPAAMPVIRTGHIEHGVLEVGIGDEGNQRMDPQSVAVSVLDPTGKVLLQKDVMANYVLPGSTWPLHLKLPANVCDKAASVSLEWSGALARTLAHPITTTGTGACASTSSN
jgi:fimbrial chaperone protein